MPDQTKITFFKENKECRDLIEKENLRRKNRQVDLLSEEEIDEAIGEMMSLLKQGQRIRAFKFPPLPSAPAPQTPIQRPQPIQHKNQNSLRFDVMLCANGFVLNMTMNGTVEPFIFKTEQDLMEIFKELLFKELKILKERRPDDKKIITEKKEIPQVEAKKESREISENKTIVELSNGTGSQTNAA